MKQPYKKVTGDEWNIAHQGTHPNAVHNTDKSEYILSCNDGSGELTRKHAQDYIAENWTKKEEENYVI